MKDSKIKASRKYYENNKEKVKERYKKNKERIKEKNSRKTTKDHRKNLLKQKYDIAQEDIDFMILCQMNCCAICGNEFESKVTKKGWTHPGYVIDHCHTTGKVRGLLCIKCNCGLGYFDDNKEKLKSAINYLS